MLDLSTTQNLKPLLNSRKQEMYAWIISIVLLLVLFVIPLTRFSRIGGILLFFFFFLSATAMSVGNWVNKKSELRLNNNGMWFTEGIRENTIKWENIDRVEVYPGRISDKIKVIGGPTQFTLDVIGIESEQDKQGFSLGFEQGDLILNTILYKAEFDSKNIQQGNGYYYYQKI